MDLGERGGRHPNPPLPSPAPISPPQAKLNVSVRALASSAPELQVASGDAMAGWSRRAAEGGRKKRPSWLGTLLVLRSPTGG